MALHFNAKAHKIPAKLDSPQCGCNKGIHAGNKAEKQKIKAEGTKGSLSYKQTERDKQKKTSV